MTSTSSSAPPGPAARRPIVDESHARAALTALWVVLALLAITRVALMFVPSMEEWGLNLGRFIRPDWAWIGLAAATLALAPPLANALVPLATRIGNALAGGRARTDLAIAAIAMLLVLVFPDRVRYVGDFLLRQGTVEESARAGTLFPQALPLDVFLHVTLPGTLAAWTPLDANSAARAIGALEAGVLALLARRFARVLALEGVAAFAATAIVFFGGWLGLYTGYSKAFGEMVLLIAVFGVAGIGSLRDGGGRLALGLAFSAGLLLHRSALGLLPALIAAWWMAWRGPVALRPARRATTGLALAVPLVTLLALLPRLIATMRQWDVVHVASPEVRAAGGLLPAMFAGPRAIDLSNLLVTLTPFAAALPVMLLAPGVRTARHREFLWLALLALPFAASLLIVHPAQGLFRDWDDFAAAGLALALIAAWCAGAALDAAPRMAWVGVAAIVAAAVHGKMWLIHHADLDRGLARMNAFMQEPPARGATERATTLDFIGIRSFRAGRYDAAAEAWQRAAGIAPSPRILREWGTAERQRGQYDTARDAFRMMVERNPDDPIAWAEYGDASARLGDAKEVRRAAAEIERIRPGAPIAESLRRVAQRLATE